MDSSRECRHATCPAISPGCERCVTSRNRSPSSPPDPVNSLRPRKRRADPSIAAVHACPNAPTRAVNQPYSLPHRRNTGRAQPTATRNTRIPVSREIDASIYFYDIHSQVELRLCLCFRFNQHVVGGGFAGDGDAEQRAEGGGSGVAHGKSAMANLLKGSCSPYV